MMYSEFVENTGCKQNEHNYKVFQNLEAMYMNTEMTKEEIYEYGKKLVDNSKTEEEIAFENGIKEQIEAHEYFIKYNGERIAAIKEYIKEFPDVDIDKARRLEIKQKQGENRKYRAIIASLKEVIA